VITTVTAGSARRRGRWLLATAATLGALLGPSVWMPRSADAATGLSSFSGVARSETLALTDEVPLPVPSASPVEVLVGATRVEGSSEPRAQADGATLAVRSAALPGDRGQCRAAYPDGPSQDTCGRPVPPPIDALIAPGGTGGDGLPLAPGRGPLTGPTAAKLLMVDVQASGEPRSERIEARSSAVLAGLALGDVVHVRAGVSRSRWFVRDGAVHAVTVSEVTDVIVGDVLGVGTLRATAEAVHPTGSGSGWATARTEALDVTVAGVPVTLGPDGVEVEGRPLPPASAATTAAARRVIDALVSRGMTIEPLPPPRTRGEPGGAVEASSPGVRVLLHAPGGGTATLVLGLAQVRIAAQGARQASLVPRRSGLPVTAASGVAPPHPTPSAASPGSRQAPPPQALPRPALPPQTLPPPALRAPEIPVPIESPPSPPVSLPPAVALVVGFLVVLAAVVAAS
jgi:hypothetical protein